MRNIFALAFGFISAVRLSSCVASTPVPITITKVVHQTDETPTETVQITATQMPVPTKTNIPPTPTFPAPEGADLPDSALRSVNEQGQEVILDQPGGDALWTLIEDENGELAWQKTETIREKISASLPAADYSAVAAETRKAIEEGELSHEQALQYWQPVLELHFPEEVMAQVWPEIDEFSVVPESGLMELKSEGQVVISQNEDGSSFILAKEALENHLNEVIIAQFSYFAFLPGNSANYQADYNLQRAIFDASVESPAEAKEYVIGHMSELQANYREFVANLSRLGYEVEGYDPYLGLCLTEKESGERYYFVPGADPTPLDTGTPERDLEKGIMRIMPGGDRQTEDWSSRDLEPKTMSSMGLIGEVKPDGTLVWDYRGEEQGEAVIETHDFVPGQAGLAMAFMEAKDHQCPDYSQETEPGQEKPMRDCSIEMTPDFATPEYFVALANRALAEYPSLRGKMIKVAVTYDHNDLPERHADSTKRSWSPNMSVTRSFPRYATSLGQLNEGVIQMTLLPNLIGDSGELASHRVQESLFFALHTAGNAGNLAMNQYIANARAQDTKVYAETKTYYAIFNDEFATDFF
jgi:hypothetical protein